MLLCQQTQLFISLRVHLRNSFLVFWCSQKHKMVNSFTKNDDHLVQRLNKNPNTAKDTRWDRIRKRYSSNSVNNGMKTDTIKRFIAMDFVGKHNERMLNGDIEESQRNFDPVLVMNMRHEIFRKIPRKLPLATVAHPQQQQLESCIAHNVAVEERYIEHELKKFQNQLQKNYKRNQFIFKSKRDALKIDNSQLKQSLSSTHKLIEDFYAAPIEALESVHEFSTVCLGKEVEEKKLEPLVVDEISQEADNFHNPNKESDCIVVSNCSMSDKSLPITSPEIKRTVSFLCEVNEKPYTSSNTSDLIDDNVREEVEKQKTAPTIQNTYRNTEVSEKSNNRSNANDFIDHNIRVEIKENKLENLTNAPSSQNTDFVNELGPERESELHQSLKIDKDEPTQLLIINRLTLKANPHERSISNDLYSPSSNDANDDDTSATNSEQNHIISELFQAQTHTSKATLRRFFLLWKHYTTMEKLERENCSTKLVQVQRINAFLDKVRKEKVRQMKTKSQKDNDPEYGGGVNAIETKSTGSGIGAAVIAKKYKNKIKVQQDIIDLQRVKLERQERLIMELKLHKISEEAKDARQDVKKELQAVISYGNPKAKAKAKCLQLIGNIRDNDDEDEFTRLRGKSLLVPKFLQKMQERALERSIKHDQAKQRRLQLEAEREAQKIAIEEAKRMEDEEAKRMRIEILAEKRRQEKMAKLIKERERQRAIENHYKAQEFCRRLLLRRVGMEAFKRLVLRKHENQQKSEAFRQRLYKRKCFLEWHTFYILESTRKLQMATKFSEMLVKRNMLITWKLYVSEQRCKLNVAIDWHELKLTEKIFHIWFMHVRKMRVIEDVKMQQATAHHEWHLKWKVLTCWQRLPQILQIEKETEERRQKWRLKIWELLPDYTPNKDDLY